MAGTVSHQCVMGNVKLVTSAVCEQLGKSSLKRACKQKGAPKWERGERNNWAFNGKNTLLQEQENSWILLFLWRCLPQLDDLAFVLMKAFPAAGVFICCFPPLGSAVSNSNFILQPCFLERTVAQDSVHIFLRLPRIGYNWAFSVALNGA